jgi:hypothetical protein
MAARDAFGRCALAVAFGYLSIGPHEMRDLYRMLMRAKALRLKMHAKTLSLPRRNLDSLVR